MSNRFKEIRRDLIHQVYIVNLGRVPSERELSYYINSNQPIEEIVYSIAYMSSGQEKGTKLPLSLAVFCKDNQDSIELCIRSVLSVVSEIIVVDTGSTDNTLDICKRYTDKIYKVGFTDFGSIRTLTAHLATQPWVLGLDSDETISKEQLPLIENLLADETVDLWGLPRRRWADLGRTTQVEIEAYPDYQYRLFRNDKKIKYVGRVHESAEGPATKKESPEGPHIDHFQDVFKSGDALKKRNELYKKLYELDTVDGIIHSCPPVSSIDDDR